MDPIVQPGPLPIAVSIPGGLEPRRSILIDGHIPDNADSVRLQCGPSIIERDDIAISITFYFTDKTTSYSINSYISDAWEDPKEEILLLAEAVKIKDPSKKLKSDKAKAKKAKEKQTKSEDGTKPMEIKQVSTDVLTIAEKETPEKSKSEYVPIKPVKKEDGPIKLKDDKEVIDHLIKSEDYKIANKDESLKSEEYKQTITDESIKSEEYKIAIKDDLITSEENKIAIKDESIKSERYKQLIKDKSLKSEEYKNTIRDESLKSEEHKQAIKDEALKIKGYEQAIKDDLMKHKKSKKADENEHIKQDYQALDEDAEVMDKNVTLKLQSRQDLSKQVKDAPLKRLDSKAPKIIISEVEPSRQTVIKLEKLQSDKEYEERQKEEKSKLDILLESCHKIDAEPICFEINPETGLPLRSCCNISEEESMKVQSMQSCSICPETPGLSAYKQPWSPCPGLSMHEGEMPCTACKKTSDVKTSSDESELNRLEEICVASKVESSETLVPCCDEEEALAFCDTLIQNLQKTYDDLQADTKKADEWLKYSFRSRHSYISRLDSKIKNSELIKVWQSASEEVKPRDALVDSSVVLKASSVPKDTKQTDTQTVGKAPEKAIKIVSKDSNVKEERDEPKDLRLIIKFSEKYSREPIKDTTEPRELTDTSKIQQIKDSPESSKKYSEPSVSKKPTKYIEELNKKVLADLKERDADFKPMKKLITKSTQTTETHIKSIKDIEEQKVSKESAKLMRHSMSAAKGSKESTKLMKDSIMASKGSKESKKLLSELIEESKQLKKDSLELVKEIKKVSNQLGGLELSKQLKKESNRVARSKGTITDIKQTTDKNSTESTKSTEEPMSSKKIKKDSKQEPATYSKDLTGNVEQPYDSKRSTEHSIETTSAKEVKKSTKGSMNSTKESKERTSSITSMLEDLIVREDLKDLSDRMKVPSKDSKDFSKGLKEPLKDSSKGSKEPLKDSKDSKEPLKDLSKDSSEPLKNSLIDSKEPLKDSKDSSKGSKEPLKGSSKGSKEPLKDSKDSKEPLKDLAKDSSEPLKNPLIDSKEPLKDSKDSSKGSKEPLQDSKGSKEPLKDLSKDSSEPLKNSSIDSKKSGKKKAKYDTSGMIMRRGADCSLLLDCNDTGFSVYIESRHICDYKHRTDYDLISFMVLIGDLKVIQAGVAGAGGPTRWLIHDTDLYEPWEQSYIIVLRDDTFDKTILESSEMWLITFYENQCEFHKAWEEAAETLKTKVFFAVMDCLVNLDTVERLELDRVPAVLFFPEGNKSLKSYEIFDGEYTASGIVDWALHKFKKKEGPPPGARTPRPSTTLIHKLSIDRERIDLKTIDTQQTEDESKKAIIEVDEEGTDATEEEDIIIKDGDKEIIPSVYVTDGKEDFSHELTKTGLIVYTDTIVTEDLDMEMEKRFCTFTETVVPLLGYVESTRFNYEDVIGMKIPIIEYDLNEANSNFELDTLRTKSILKSSIDIREKGASSKVRLSEEAVDISLDSNLLGEETIEKRESKLSRKVSELIRRPKRKYLESKYISHSEIRS